MKNEIQHLPQSIALSDAQLELLRELEEDAAESERGIKSDSTLRTYANGWNHFAAYCESLGVPSLPAEPLIVRLWIRKLWKDGSPRRTVETWLAAIAHYHTEAGYNISPTSAETVKRTLKAFRRKVRKTEDSRRGVTLAEIEGLVRLCRKDNREGARGRGWSGHYQNIRDAALLSIWFWGGLRASEVAALRLGNLQPVEGYGYSVTIAQSKTDQTGKGYGVPLLALPGMASCPVTNLRAWLEVREQMTVDSDLLFIGMNQFFRMWSRMKPEKVKPMSRQALTNLLLTRLKEAGLSTDSISSHSMRIGFITEMDRHGGAKDGIARHVRHSDTRQTEAYTRHRSIFDNCVVSTIRERIIAASLEGNAVMKL